MPPFVTPGAPLLSSRTRRSGIQGFYGPPAHLPLSFPHTSLLSSRTQIRDPGFIWPPAFARVTRKRARVTGKRAWQWKSVSVAGASFIFPRTSLCLSHALPFVFPAHLPFVFPDDRSGIQAFYMALRFREGDKEKERGL